ncbi:MAG: ATP-dependent DNA helicase RecG [Candidatus Omnitrophota bacterium]|nr:ATP-dependent DNA helicase RecG [Candidatus Omnitrophota bacterium]
MNKDIATPIQYLKGIGPKRAKLFQRIGVNSIEDLLYYFPRRYEDRANFSPIGKLEAGQVCAVQGKILAKGEHQSWRRRGFTITEAMVADASGKISCVWFNQPYLKNYFQAGDSLILFGKAELYGKRLQLSAPEFELIGKDSDNSLDIGRLVPVYSLPEGLTQRGLRHLVNLALGAYLSQLNDCLDFDLRSRNMLVNLAQALRNIHFPESSELQHQAYTRLCFEEFFLFQLPLLLRKLRKKEHAGIAHRVESPLLESFISGLPFQLTGAQQKVFAEIKADMASPRSMQRLLQGDVGSGKTVVATAAAVIAVSGGYQAAFMAPTEILARQHYEKIKSQVTLCRGQASHKSQVRIGLLTSGAGGKEKKQLYQQIKEGKIDLIIGTHALLEEKVEFKQLGLVVIDEQHKFGVGQRALLPKKGPNPDCLIMTATPIPRTLAITLYGDLDISVINELPPGRMPVKTLHLEGKERGKACEIAKEQLTRGRQAYIIYPVIEESFALDISGAKKMYESLRKNEFKEFKVGLIHGRLEQKEQSRIMQKFKDRELDVLVSTTVLEVGIDIANATCMIVEHAERFGLAQLHQLRGRVGRGEAESCCILLSSARTDEALARLAAMVQYNDGFRIAEVDLKIRGPGEFFGARQHGLSELKIGNPLAQMQLLKRAREEAIRLINSDPGLEARPHRPLKEKLLQRFPEYEKLMVVG